MKDKKQIDEFIETLQKYELSIARLYETFASVLTDFKKNWLSFAGEEHLHAKWIDTLHAHLNDGKVSFEETKFTIQSTQTAINFIEKQIDKTIKEKPDLKQCLNIAINIENSLLESAFFKVFKLTVPEAEKIRSKLEAATKSHTKRLIEWRERITKA